MTDHVTDSVYTTQPCCSSGTHHKNTVSTFHYLCDSFALLGHPRKNVSCFYISYDYGTVSVPIVNVLRPNAVVISPVALTGRSNKANMTVVTYFETSCYLV